MRLRAARHGLSIEQEVRNILQRTLAAESAAMNGLDFAKRINQRFSVASPLGLCPILSRHEHGFCWIPTSCRSSCEPCLHLKCWNGSRGKAPISSTPA
ncbi:FitA-like ribbon-helix-helix domain-containing protein [Hydrogenophaga sp.]|uniref:FitA-like ribbon-helix-helix domain-containing protein n=1 Tax=Hydrogenophaga sp. TaxID=1904254 RepID=UPI0039FD2C85